jgi:hypothetical protein
MQDIKINSAKDILNLVKVPHFDANLLKVFLSFRIKVLSFFFSFTRPVSSCVDASVVKPLMVGLARIWDALPARPRDSLL